jgi:hypothetical protein
VPYKDRDKKNANKRRYYRLLHPLKPKPPKLTRRERNAMKHGESRASRKAYISEYKATHPCVDCGESDPVVLDFDHRDPAEKSFAISSARNTSMRQLIAEIAKCDVRCANCHRRRTHRERHSLFRREDVSPCAP